MELTASGISEDSIKPSPGLKGVTDLPGDAELSIIALALASTADGISEVRRCSRRRDVERTGELLSELGIMVARDGETATVTGAPFRATDNVLNVDGSLILFSCLAGLLSSAPFVTRLSGVQTEDGVDRVAKALRSLGAHVNISVTDGISAGVGGSRLAPGSYRVGRPDLAVKCGVLMAGLGVDGPVELLQDTGGDDDLEVLLRAAGCDLKKKRIKEDGGYQLLMEGPARLRAATHELPGSPDAGLFLALAAAMLNQSDLTLSHFGMDSRSRRIVDILRRMNVAMDVTHFRTDSGFPARNLRIRGSDLRGIRIAGANARLMRDVLPLVAVAGAVSRGETIIRDAGALRNGPVDCISVLVENLRKMDIQVGEMPDGLVVKGGQPQGDELDAAGDARVSMALRLAALASEGDTLVRNPGPVDQGMMDRLASVQKA
ncbi:MAG: hypothetical protein OXR72_02685 [Gemmatimonadota bacterium]|nr:hypothetical protein [Gemmatimonadota bacterium]